MVLCSDDDTAIREGATAQMSSASMTADAAAGADNFGQIAQNSCSNRPAASHSEGYRIEGIPTFNTTFRRPCPPLARAAR